MFSCEFCEIFKKTVFTEHLRTAASVYKSPSQTFGDCFFDFTEVSLVDVQK